MLWTIWSKERSSERQREAFTLPRERPGRVKASFSFCQDLIHQMLIVIHNHYMKKIYLKDIAAVVNISEEKCCR